MTRRVLTTIGSATAVATAVGACLLLGPAPQAQATTGRLCDPKTGNCVTFTQGGGFQVTNATNTTVATVTWSPFCVTATSPTSGPFTFGAC